MKKLMMITAAAALLASPVLAQSADTNHPKGVSKENSGAAMPSQPDDKANAPKTVGAMNKTVGAVATSPQDVAAQQQGKKTAAEGGGEVKNAPDVTKNKGPKTTGAAPGADYR